MTHRYGRGFSAVDCAVAVQRALADGPIKLRIGINLGDVIIEGSDIYGDGVNVAARIQSRRARRGRALSLVVAVARPGHRAFRASRINQL